MRRFVGKLARRLRFEPVVVSGVIVSVALFLGFNPDPQIVGDVVGVLLPFVASLVTRSFTRSRASLD